MRCDATGRHSLSLLFVVFVADFNGKFLLCTLYGNCNNDDVKFHFNLNEQQNSKFISNTVQKTETEPSANQLGNALKLMCTIYTHTHTVCVRIFVLVNDTHISGSNGHQIGILLDASAVSVAYW